MKTQEVTPELKADAEEAHRRKLLAGRDTGSQATLAETALVYSYGRVVQVTDFVQTWRLNLLPLDMNGKRVRVLIPRYWPLRVPANMLDNEDVLVVADFRRDAIRFLGWLPISHVEEAPVSFFEKDGKRLSYSHEIDQGYLFEMPDTFDFTDHCLHLDAWMALWEYSPPGWLCSGCGQVLYADEDRRIFERQDARLGFGNTISKTS